MTIRIGNLKRKATTMNTPLDPRYPIGNFKRPLEITPDLFQSALDTLSNLPNDLRNATKGLDAGQLDTPYREGGWTVRQLVHHIADSHMHAFLRIRFALTEDSPVIKPYDENAWATLHDANAPIQWSMTLLEGLHARWVMLLQSLTVPQLQRAYMHPENGPTNVQTAAMLYAWHSRHHVAHITHLRARMDW